MSEKGLENNIKPFRNQNISVHLVGDDITEPNYKWTSVVGIKEHGHITTAPWNTPPVHINLGIYNNINDLLISSGAMFGIHPKYADGSSGARF